MLPSAGAASKAEETALLAEAKTMASARQSDSRAGGGRGGKGGGRGSRAKGAAPESPTRAAAEPEVVEVKEEPAPLLEGVRLLALDAHEEDAAWEGDPTFVVMYDPDIAFIRQTEVYKAARPGALLRVYHLRHDDSAETDKFQAAAERERRALESLIHSKGHMVLPLLPDPRQVGMRERLAAGQAMLPIGTGGVDTNNALTRRGGRSAGKVQPVRVVVDVREFMSNLPAVLHQQGFEVVPVTLEVGDYILSPELCVERKSLPDLRQSLASGRLYNQAQAMSAHYKLPVLLIEFDREKAFALQSANELGDDIGQNSLMSRLCLLVLHFPRLRLIWSRSLHATADIFRDLKSNLDEPDAVVAACIGLPVSADGTGGASETIINKSAEDVLRRLPGVTEANYRTIMANCTCLADLADMTIAQLEPLMGSHLFAKKLYDFLHAPCPVADA